jgi:stress response protein YsnF
MTEPEHDLDTYLSWRGRTVVDRKGERIGKLGELYLDEATDRPAYAGVRTGLVKRHESIVPLARMAERDGDLVVPYDAELVRDAPSIDPDVALDDAEQERLARHYATAGPGAEMVRSEEEVVTGTTPMQPTERVRLRKVLVTEDVTTTVPVRREEIRLETDPPPEGDIQSVEDVPARDEPA